MSLECKPSLLSEEEQKIAVLKKRAEFLAKTRSFFAEHSVLEVDTPLIGQYAAIGCSIDVMEVIVSDEEEKRYLCPSPEFGMKRLLSLGIGDIYQLSHVFRRGEHGRIHNPEFTMCEWYRIGWEFDRYIEEVIEYVELFIGSKPKKFYTFEKAFQLFLQVSSQKSSLDELIAVAKQRGCSSLLNRDEALDFLYSELEKELPKDDITIITDFPSSKAALSEIHRTQDGFMVAKRFEIFYQGVELANGYKELTDAVEQKRRLVEEAEYYLKVHQKKRPIDTLFLEALERGMPSCCGVACGFDRLLMLALELRDFVHVLPWRWEEA